MDGSTKLAASPGPAKTTCRRSCCFPSQILDAKAREAALSSALLSITKSEMNVKFLWGAENYKVGCSYAHVKSVNAWKIALPLSRHECFFLSLLFCPAPIFLAEKRASRPGLGKSEDGNHLRMSQKMCNREKMVAFVEYPFEPRYLQFRHPGENWP